MTEWISVTERLPDFNLPVWLHEAGIMFVGVRVDDVDGWLWARCYDTHHYDNKARCWKSFGAELDDDYKPTHWMPLPEPPALSDTTGAPPKGAEKIRTLAMRLAFALADHRYAQKFGDKAGAAQYSAEADKVWKELMAAIDAGAPLPESDERLDATAHEIWAAAQLVPGEGIVDGVDRIVAILKGTGND